MKKIKITPNGIVEENLTAEEIAQAEANDAEFQLKLQQEEAEKQDAITKKASGKQKLLDLGLSEEEVKAMIGI